VGVVTPAEAKEIVRRDWYANGGTTFSGERLSNVAERAIDDFIEVMGLNEYRTASGKVLTDADIQKLSKEAAARDYDPKGLGHDLFKMRVDRDRLLKAFRDGVAAYEQQGLELERAIAVIRADHAIKAAQGGGPCVCEWCKA
jgi:hypothetical protein